MSDQLGESDTFQPSWERALRYKRWLAEVIRTYESATDWADFAQRALIHAELHGSILLLSDLKSFELLLFVGG